MCALDCAQIAQVQLKLSIQFLFPYCVIFKNLNSIFIIAVGPLVLSAPNIIIIRIIIIRIIIISFITIIVVISCRIIIALTLPPYSFVRLRLLALSHGHLVAYCNVLHSYRYSPAPTCHLSIPHAHIYSPYSPSHPISFPVTTLGGRVDKMTMETEVETREIRESSLFGYCE